MSAVRLTVGIPTYNRAEDLRVACESVLAQVDSAFRGQIEILICDNASTDATKAVARDYMARYPSLFAYHRQPENLGFSRNVDAVVRHARGDFVLLLGDDDGLEPHALATLGDILSRHDDVGVVFLAEMPYDSDLRAPLDMAADRLGRTGGTLYRPGLEYVRCVRAFPPFLMSGYVVRREAWLKARPADFLETICVHALATLRILSGYAAYMSYVPVIRYRMENKGGNRWTDQLYPFTFYLNLLAGCRGIKAEYPAALHRCLHQQAMRSIIFNMLTLLVSRGPIQVPLLRSRLKELADRSDPLFWLSMLLLWMPAWLVRGPVRMALCLRSSTWFTWDRK